jgi:hypothetical protein
MSLDGQLSAFHFLGEYIWHAKEPGGPITCSISHLYLRLQLPLMLPFLHHLIYRLLAHLHSLPAGRNSAIYCRLKGRLSDLNFRKTVVDGASGMYGQLWPALQCDQHAEIYSIVSHAYNNSDRRLNDLESYLADFSAFGQVLALSISLPSSTPLPTLINVCNCPHPDEVALTSCWPGQLNSLAPP